jgi:hypothetical protein
LGFRSLTDRDPRAGERFISLPRLIRGGAVLDGGGEDRDAPGS